ncbi:glutamate--tRNA ligase [candidate division KSB3 bacterium]|uniref:Glutamate--tRNA ligase n=1 Tax=candidate division KSB3 bacterium TaxID=2044937 RepID=A0A9D5JVS3_9BACT|nr:glutamate--tRNA ligase [candidate division KSB3 bacterium]MBD3325053.1 glutamate--tRNA ligase [candidate division KSB3 bacterium]
MTTIRTRFAPSPTGYLHIGGARTALFNWLFARHHNGTFVLRIEDTDAERSTPEAIQAILDSMTWLGLDWDEGPFYQTQRYDLYRDHAYRLLESGSAYRCYCTPDELKRKREQAVKAGQPYGYDRTCRDRLDQPEGQPFVIRFKAPLDGTTTVHDLVQDDVAFPNVELDDLIILRSDGSPTYNFCVVVDDTTMQITHVIRGNDHLSNTPKQVLMYAALGYPVPQFAHIPLILGQDKTKLSKRHAATSVMAYQENGYLPEAVVNFLVRLGWAHGDQEIFTRQEMIDHFSLEGVGKSAGVFNTEKLLWLNQHYLKETPLPDLAKQLLPFLEKRYSHLVSPLDGEPLSSDSPWLHEVIQTLQERSKTLVEMADALGYYFVEEVSYQEKAARKFLTPDTAELFDALVPRLEAADAFDSQTLSTVVRDFAAQQELKLGKVAQPIRVALTGGTASPGIFDVMALLGKTTVITRLRRASEWIRAAH